MNGYNPRPWESVCRLLGTAQALTMLLWDESATSGLFASYQAQPQRQLCCYRTNPRPRYTSVCINVARTEGNEVAKYSSSVDLARRLLMFATETASGRMVACYGNCRSEIVPGVGFGRVLEWFNLVAAETLYKINTFSVV